MHANIRPAITCTALGVTVLASLGSVGCNNPAADALSSALKPLTSKYSVGGTVSGLSGSGLVLDNNGGDDLAVSANGSFTFATDLAVGAGYAVAIKTQPGSPAQTCSVANASGSVASANVTNVSVKCTNNPMAATTAVGTALASPPAAKVIDATGGSIRSADGRMTVTVPPGVVAVATNFTIQPITNQAPGGVGKAYRLGPAGETFSTPVSVSLHYSSADLAGTVSDLLSLAYQDSQGRWGVYKSVALDAASETLTVASTHFSDWALVAGESLEPAAARIGTGQTQALTLMSCDVVDFGDPLIEYAALCRPIGDANSWSASGVPGGNSAVGTVAGVGQTAATYTAPGQIPASNPVAVSVDALVTPLGENQTQELFVSNITIGGCSAANAQECTWTGTSSAADSHWKATATVTWKFQASDPGDPNVVTYEPASGSVTLTDLQPNCTVDGAPHPITSAAPSRLTIDYNTTPPSVGGDGANVTGWTESCTPPQNPPARPGAVWFADRGSKVSADGMTIEGSAKIGGLSASWNFSAR